MTSTGSLQLNGLLQRAIDAFHAGQVQQAIELLTTHAGEFSDAPRLWGYLGFLYGEAGDDGKAARALRRATLLSPHSERASLGLFHSLWRHGKVDAAFREMRRFVKEYDAPQYRELLRGMLSEPADLVPSH